MKLHAKEICANDESISVIAHLPLILVRSMKYAIMSAAGVLIASIKASHLIL